MFGCFIDDFKPSENYSHSEIQEIIKSRRNVLCFYAKETKQERCALGIDFDRYDQKDCSVPLHIFSDDEIWALSLVQGDELQNAYKQSKIGKDIIVVYSDRNCKGWFRMEFELGKYAHNLS